MRSAPVPPATDAPACTAASALTWVLVDGELRHVSAFAALRPRARPAARCPACDGPVTLKLGAVRTHHAAHRPGEECSASGAESVLHLNVKCHVAAMLRAAIGRGAPLRILAPCVAGRAAERDGPLAVAEGAGTHAGGVPSWEHWGMPCRETSEQRWVAAWDRVELEHGLRDEREARRPDIVLWQGARVVGAVEIRHRHAVDAQKARSLAALAVPWIEVAADAALADPVAGWSCAQPLPVLRCAPAGGQPWRCARHGEQFRQWRARRDDEAAEAREAARRTPRLQAVRVVDIAYPSGRTRRVAYRMDAVERDGVRIAYTLRRGGDLVAEQPAGGDERVAPLLRAAFRDDVRHLVAHHGAIVDSPMRWATGPLAERILVLATDAPAQLALTHPPRYRWVPDQRRWFQPPDLRGVRWDRAPDDTLAPHPAALRPLPPRRRPPPADVPDPSEALGPCAVGREELPGATVHLLAESAGGPATHRVIVVPTRQLEPSEARRIDDTLAAAGRQRLWLAPRASWTRELVDLPWLPIFRHATGAVLVSAWGRSRRLHDVVGAFARGDRRLRPAAVIEARHAARLKY